MAADAAFQYIVDQLTADDPIVRADAARLLGEIKRTDAVAALAAYLEKEQCYSKVAGIYALWQIADPGAIAVLQVLIENPNVPDDWYWYGRRAVVASAAIGLAIFGDESGIPFMQDLVEKNHDMIVCWYGPTILRLSRGTNHVKPAEALREIAKSITVDTLFNTVPNSKRMIEPGLLTMTAEVLGLIGTKAAQSKLAEMFTHSSRYVRARAAVSLLEADASPENLERISGLLKSDHTDLVAIKASLALAQSFDDVRQKYTDVIARIATDTADPFDRAVAIESLGVLGAGCHTEIIVKSFEDTDAYVRQCAAEACPADPALQERIETLQQSDSAPRVRLAASKWLATFDQQDEVTR